MAKFEAKEKEFYIDDQKVIKGYESFTGWYWFATEEAYKQDSFLPNGKEVQDDIVYFGFVQGLEEEWGYFSKAEIEYENMKWMLSGWPPEPVAVL